LVLIREVAHHLTDLILIANKKINAMIAQISLRLLGCDVKILSLPNISEFIQY